MKKEVVIVGGGPSGLATSACLNLLSIPNVILERENCYNSLWKKRSYDRLKLHLAKEFCNLPHFPHPKSSPTYIPKDAFIKYVDDYVSHFNLNPLCCKYVESASYDEETKTWRVMSKDTNTGEVDEYIAKFLVVAIGENAEGYIPDVPGLESFHGSVLHSSQYKSGSKYKGDAALVVGCGNSGMEIAFDLANYGAKTSISVRSAYEFVQFHVVPKEVIHMGMVLLKYLPLKFVDTAVNLFRGLLYGDLGKYGIYRPKDGPFFLKATTGRSPVIDVGTISKIKSGEIQVLPEIKEIRGSEVVFSDGKSHPFDAIIFSTGYKSTANYWLKDGEHLLNKEGFPKEKFPNHWKGKNGLYFAGLARRGLAGVSMDAQNIANDIKKFFSAVVTKASPSNPCPRGSMHIHK
ncbi:putative indole-3-pyruvate monooxygenase YUCCA10 [Acorus gramineus]|uniref:Flavin-containing monooxygenase n=1 Tax=Acorus gramineus TaxID=55184 RepID=A0AAV9BJ31_ACOGR|nr:putative indole-3-pyruvate monooxygenase YUCCA10 [Acorus gramineus]